MSHARVISVSSTPIALKVRCRTTPEQNRMMYLAFRPAVQAQLAEQWRLSRSTCGRCAYKGGEHALWCPDWCPDQ